MSHSANYPVLSFEMVRNFIDMTSEIKKLIAAANQRLIAGNIGVRIEAKNKLVLRATLPPKLNC
jgi:hypothetical protein